MEGARSARRVAVLARQIVPNYVSSTSSIQLPMVVEPEVAEALRNGRPVVALESTIISHGMPYPQNFETAVEVEQVVRANGAVPATIAILDGIIHIGLNTESLRKLAQLGHKCHKCSRRDLAYIISQRANGATTVASTMYLAHMAGIEIFVTGGIGGVHRGVEESMDISADLTELGRTPVTVICAGAKSILDIPRTMEYLETQGVGVIGFRCDNFPAFFSPDSGHPAPLRLDTVEAVAAVIDSSRTLRLNSGMVVGVPIPADQAAAAEPMERATAQALQEANSKNIKGREVTPFLLQRVNELTKGQSLKANIALVKHNASIGSQIASALSSQRRQKTSQIQKVSKKISAEAAAARRPVIVGGLVLDVIAKPLPNNKLILRTSNPGSLERSTGGVGCNIGRCMHLAGVSPLLISVCGEDESGQALINSLKALGMTVEGIQTVSTGRTAVYQATLDESGDMFVAVADMGIFKEISAPLVSRFRSELESASVVAFDGNISTSAMTAICEIANSKNVPVLFECTSIAKCLPLIHSRLVSRLTFIKPNVGELVAMATALSSAGKTVSDVGSEGNRDFNNIEKLAAIVLEAGYCSNGANGFRGLQHIIVTMGSDGVLLGSSLNRVIKFTRFNAKPTQVVNATGAGDCLVGGFLWAYHNGLSVADCVVAGMEAAQLTLQSQESVPLSIQGSRLLAAVREYNR